MASGNSAHDNSNTGSYYSTFVDISFPLVKFSFIFLVSELTRSYSERSSDRNRESVCRDYDKAYQELQLLRR